MALLYHKTEEDHTEKIKGKKGRNL
jgi:hypothetical protein